MKRQRRKQRQKQPDASRRGSESREQINTNRPISKAKEEEKPRQGQRDSLISEARLGDAKAVTRLRKRYGITKVWTQEEIDARESS